MPKTILFHLDENCANRLAIELRRLGIDVTTTHEAGLASATEEQQLEFAYREGRVFVTHDRDFFRLHDLRIPHRGIVFSVQGKRTVEQEISRLIAIWERNEPEELEGKLVWL